MMRVNVTYALSVCELPHDTSPDQFVIITLNNITTDDDPYLQQLAKLLQITEAEEWNQQESMAGDPLHAYVTLGCAYACGSVTLQGPMPPTQVGDASLPVLRWGRVRVRLVVIRKSTRQTSD